MARRHTDQYDTDARYEFRWWPEHSAPLLRFFNQYFDNKGVEERVDIYLPLPDEPDLLPKIRGDSRFEIKQFLGAEDGLQRSKMLLSCAFPLTRKAASRIARKYNVPAAQVCRNGATAKSLLALLGETTRPRAVMKIRRIFSCDSSKIELSHVIIDGTADETAAFECTEQQQACRLRDELRLQGEQNVSYAERLMAGAGNLESA